MFSGIKNNFLWTCKLFLECKNRFLVVFYKIKPVLESKASKISSNLGWIDGFQYLPFHTNWDKVIINTDPLLSSNGVDRISLQNLESSLLVYVTLKYHDIDRSDESQIMIWFIFPFKGYFWGLDMSLFILEWIYCLIQSLGQQC